MILARQDIIRREIAAGTGAEIGMSVDASGTRSGLNIWFADLGERHGPVARLRSYGLKGYRVVLGFGTFAGEVVAQIRNAGEEDWILARALVASIGSAAEIDLAGQRHEDWQVERGTFRITATARMLPDDPDEAVARMCREVIVPVMGAMAELIGYDVIEEEMPTEGAMEGAVLLCTVRRRERNPRNRLLCIRLHGESCAGCGLEPRSVYGDAGDIVEVHHLEPLSLQGEPRPYAPTTDLVPLCPNCHRAVHTRKPTPLSLDELRSILTQRLREPAHG
jgi:5-methylcytosine-specific restriction protein A